MKKLLNFIVLSFVFLQLFSCSKKKDYIELIPSDTDFVFQLNPKSIATKANFNKIEEYKTFAAALEESENIDPALSKMFENIKSNPNKAGVDLISPIYIFGKKLNNQVIVTLVMNMGNQSDFEDQIKLIYKSVYKQDISFTEDRGYTFIEGGKKPFMAWNKKQFIFIAGEYGVSTKTLDTYFDHLILSETPLIENNSFADFLKNAQDVNLWYSGNFLTYFNKSQKSAKDLDFSQSSWANYLSFNNNNISFTQKFHPDPATKVILEKRPMWKAKINTEIYKYFPINSYLNFSFAAHPNNVRYIFDEKNWLSSMLNEYELDIDQLTNSFEGELLCSIFDFQSAKTFNVTDYFNNNSFEQTVVIPQFIIAGKMKNDDFYKQFLKNFSSSIQHNGKYYSVKIASNQHLFFLYKHNIMYITNNANQIGLFASDQFNQNNFLQSTYAAGAKNSMFANVNLNLDDYPLEVRHFLFKQLPITDVSDFEQFMHQFKSAHLKITDEYTKTGSIELKNAEGNSLEILLKFMDHTYFKLTNQSNATN